jgi:thioredoxin 1
MKNTIDVSDANFQNEVLAANPPVLVDFYATWCGPCQMIAPVIEQLANEYAGKVRVAKVDVDDAPGVAARYGITGVPTFMVFRGGEVVETIVGMTSVRRLKDVLDRVTTVIA